MLGDYVFSQNDTLPFGFDNEPPLNEFANEPSDGTSLQWEAVDFNERLSTTPTLFQPKNIQQVPPAESDLLPHTASLSSGEKSASLFSSETSLTIPVSNDPTTGYPINEQQPRNPSDPFQALDVQSGFDAYTNSSVTASHPAQTKQLSLMTSVPVLQTEDELSCESKRLSTPRLSPFEEWQQRHALELQGRENEELQLKENLKAEAQSQLAQWYEDNRQHSKTFAAEADTAFSEASSTDPTVQQSDDLVKEVNWKRVWELVTQRHPLTTTAKMSARQSKPDGATSSFKRQEPVTVPRSKTLSQKDGRRDTSRLMQLLDELKSQS